MGFKIGHVGFYFILWNNFSMRNYNVEVFYEQSFAVLLLKSEKFLIVKVFTYSS